MTLSNSLRNTIGDLFNVTIEQPWDDEIGLHVEGHIFMDVLSSIENQVYDNTQGGIGLNLSMYIIREWHKELYGYKF